MWRLPIPEEALRGLATPCLVVDLDAAQRNISRAADHFAASSAKLRPHFKAHKCTRLLSTQLAAGHCVGVTCATAREATVLAEAGFPDVLIANQVVDEHGLKAITAAGRSAKVTVVVDSRFGVEALARRTSLAGVDLGVLIEIDVGMCRCGLAPGDPLLLEIARTIEASPRLRLLGLQGYEGHAVQRPVRLERRREVERAGRLLHEERRRLLNAGFSCDIVSGGGTGTYDLATDVGVLDEVQAGSYVLMDAAYARLGLPFEPALYCCATVISRQEKETAVLNAGWKAFSGEQGLPHPVEPGVLALKASDEHLRVATPPDVELPLGAPTLVVPAHVDPTMNLHAEIYTWSPGGGVEPWAVDGRG